MTISLTIVCIYITKHLNNSYNKICIKSMFLWMSTPETIKPLYCCGVILKDCRMHSWQMLMSCKYTLHLLCNCHVSSHVCKCKFTWKVLQFTCEICVISMVCTLQYVVIPGYILVVTITWYFIDSLLWLRSGHVAICHIMVNN